MIREIPLLATPDLSIYRVDHYGHEHHDDEQESATVYSINFVEHGSFSVRSRYGSGELRAGDVLVTQPGDTYSCRHAARIPDDVCLSVSWRTHAIEADDQCASAARSSSRRIISRNNRLGYLGWRVARYLAAADTSFAAEGLALELWAAVANDSRRAPYRERQLFWYADRVEAARALMQRRFAEHITVGALARAVGMSPFHFCRIFAELAGTPPHSYLLEVRLRAAASMLRDGSPVTEACFACGFQSLSHFIRMFQRRFGVSPSRYPAI